jgi:hypothetical protein
MRQTTFLLGVAAVIAMAVIAHRRTEDEPRKGPMEEGRFVSGLQSPLEESALNDQSRLWFVFASVWELIPTKHRLNPLNALIPGVRPDEGSTATFQDGRDTYFIVRR